LFQKGQWVKKLEAAGARVKKSQIIAQVSLSRTVGDAAWCEYLEAQLRPLFRPGVLFFNRMNPNELQRWYAQHWDPAKPVTANDYTAWDTGVDAVFLAFDQWLMRHFSFPEWYVEQVGHHRAQSRTFLGPYPIMQPSGDRYTLLLNSMRNLALTGASLDFAPGTPIAVCGDDSAVCGQHATPRTFQSHLWRMQPKRSVSDVAEFCGWSFGAHELTVSLPALTHRARIGLQRGLASPDYWRSVLELYDLTCGEPWDYSELRGLFDDVRRHLWRGMPDPFE